EDEVQEVAESRAEERLLDLLFPDGEGAGSHVPPGPGGQAGGVRVETARRPAGTGQGEDAGSSASPRIFVVGSEGVRPTLVPDSPPHDPSSTHGAGGGAGSGGAEGTREDHDDGQGPLTLEE